MLLILLFGFLIFQFYSASIVGSLLMEKPKTIKTLRNLIDSSLDVGIEDIVYDHDFFRVSFRVQFPLNIIWIGAAANVKRKVVSVTSSLCRSVVSTPLVIVNRCYSAPFLRRLWSKRETRKPIVTRLNAALKCNGNQLRTQLVDTFFAIRSYVRWFCWIYIVPLFSNYSLTRTIINR